MSEKKALETNSLETQVDGVIEGIQKSDVSGVDPFAVVEIVDDVIIRVIGVFDDQIAAMTWILRIAETMIDSEKAKDWVAGRDVDGLGSFVKARDEAELTVGEWHAVPFFPPFSN